MKYLVIILTALLLSSAAPLPTALPPATIRTQPRSSIVVPQRPSQVEISAVVYGSYPGGLTGPIGEYTAVGASLGEATGNAQQLEADIRAQATAQAVQP
jgi:hypothetical protein